MGWNFDGRKVIFLEKCMNTCIERRRVKFEIAIFCRKKKKKVDLSIAKIEGRETRNWKIWGKEIESLSKESDNSLSPADYAQYRKWGLSRESGFQEWLRGTRTSLPWQRSRHVEQNGVPPFFLHVPYTDAQKENFEKECPSLHLPWFILRLRNFTLRDKNRIFRARRIFIRIGLIRVKSNQLISNFWNHYWKLLSYNFYFLKKEKTKFNEKFNSHTTYLKIPKNI